MGALGFSLPSLLALRSTGAQRSPISTTGRSSGRAKRCIVLFAWGGISHLDTWDPKPDASSDIRGEFSTIATTVPGIRMSEHMPRIARKAHQLAIVRSASHQAPSHRSAAYWNLTGQPPPNLAGNWPATRQDHPCLGSMAVAAMEAARDMRLTRSLLPSPVCLPYTMADGGRANGQDGGFLGLRYDPVIVNPRSGNPYNGVSPNTLGLDLALPQGVDAPRLAEIRSLSAALESRAGDAHGPEQEVFAKSREQAFDLMLSSAVRDAFDIEKEPRRLREAYGNHICGQSTLLARRLAEAGVPIVTVYCAAGDLNGSVGDHFDTHGDNFNRLRNAMLPPLDQASYALLEDLEQRGMLADTLVCWLTEFGRTPKVNSAAGRDHYPNCYSVAFAGGGIKGGQVYGKSDRIGAEPEESGCGPEDLHATIFECLGIDPRTVIHSMDGRPFPLCSGKPLPIT